MPAMTAIHPGLKAAILAGGCRLDADELLCRLARFIDGPPAGRAAGREEAASMEDIDRSRGGDSQAYERIIRRHQEHIAKILWRFTRDPATHEELVQDVFVEAWLSLAAYRGEAPLEHWLARIATRVGYRFWKRSKSPAAQALRLEDWDKLAGAADAKTDPKETAELVHRLLSMLPARDRLVLMLRYIEGCSVEETADRTGWSRALVKVQTWRARSKLKSLIEAKGMEVQF